MKASLLHLLRPGAIAAAALGSLFLGACANDRAVSRIALHTAQSVAGYDAAVSRKVAAEKAFYQRELTDLRQILGGIPSDEVLGLAEARQPAQTELERLQNSLPYGRVVTSAQRDARILADRIINGSSPAAMEALVSYVDAGVSAEQADVLDFIKRQRALANDFQAGLAPIKQQQDQLKALRNAMTQLAAKPSLGDQIKIASEFAKAVKEQLDSKK
jgi:hypothetical protein